MEPSGEYFRAVVDSLTEHIVVIDDTGVIEYVNPAWTQFAIANGRTINGDWLGVDYLGVCDKSAQEGEESGRKVADGIRRVIKGEVDVFYFEYPCHSDSEERWFIMRVTPLHVQDSTRYVISHQNITERKLAEEEMERISRVDGLTCVANRRHFSEFFDREWRRCMRLKQSLSLILLDIDHFKLFNDQYGHLAGDDCLKTIANVLKSFAKRPSDLCARYGGEEFVIILGNMDTKGAAGVAGAILQRIQELAIPHAASPTSLLVTASLGVAGTLPRVDADRTDLLKVADMCLYTAKKQGRNRVCTDTA